MKYKFGDVVINHSAGDSNPHKRGIVVRTGVKTGRLNPGPWVECTDGKGEFWTYGGPAERLEIVGTALMPEASSDGRL